MSHEPTEENDLETQKFVLIATVRQFSDESIHRPGQDVPFVYSVDNDRFGDIFTLNLYANGITSESKGYVSLDFRLNEAIVLSTYKYFEFLYTVGVIDSSGNKRFLRSFVFPDGPKCRTDILSLTFDVDRYIERETLLSEPLDLLPEDCLVLYIDADFKTTGSLYKLFEVEDILDDSFKTERYGNDSRYYLYLDSAVAERLKGLSTYFQRMSECEMKEKRIGCLEIPADESESFSRICRILVGSEYIIVHSIHDICLMYILADKYDIPVAIETCRRLMVGFLREKNDETIVQHVDESIPEVLQLAERFNDVRLKDIVERFLNYKEEGIENGNRTRKDKQDNLETEWWVTFEGRIPGIHAYAEENVLLFYLCKGGKMCQDKHEFEFYQ